MPDTSLDGEEFGVAVLMQQLGWQCSDLKTEMNFRGTRYRWRMLQSEDNINP